MLPPTPPPPPFSFADPTQRRTMKPTQPPWFPELSNSGSPPAEPGAYPLSYHGLHTRCLRLAAQLTPNATQDSLPVGGQPLPGKIRTYRVHYVFRYCQLHLPFLPFPDLIWREACSLEWTRRSAGTPGRRPPKNISEPRRGDGGAKGVSSAEMARPWRALGSEHSVLTPILELPIMEAGSGVQVR